MINSIRLVNFRSFKDKTFSLNNNLVIFIGNNAVGKTSVLEAIYYLCTTKSHRTNNYLNLISYDQNNAYVIINFNENIYKIVLNKKNKLYFINNKEINRIKFIGQIKTIIFSPYDLNLVNGSLSDKRKFLDLNISLLNNDYLKKMLIYKKILRKRNEILKSKVIDNILLKVVTDSLIPYTKYINEVRNKFIIKLNNYLKEICEYLKIEEIKIISDIKNIDYDNFLNKDIYYKTTTWGPHRDGFNIFINDKELKTYGSQGQIKLAVIVIKLALYEIIREKNKPILLLDDIFAELDKEKQIKLVNYLNNYQTIITTTSLNEIPEDLLQKALIIKLRKDDIND